MATASAREPRTRSRPKWSLPPEADRITVADLLKQLGGIPPEGVRLCPIPSTATEDDKSARTLSQSAQTAELAVNSWIPPTECIACPLSN